MYSQIDKALRPKFEDCRLMVIIVITYRLFHCVVSFHMRKHEAHWCG